MNRRWLETRSGMAASVALCLAVLLAACGPGVGGTGTGGSAQALPLGASAAPLCGSALAGALQCAAGGAVPGPAAPAGSARVWWSDSTIAWRSSARIEGDQIELTLACEGLVFVGSWGALPGQAERFFGSVTVTASGRTEAATLAAQLSGGGIAVQLDDAQGQPLASPKLLQPVPAPPAPGGCTR